VDLGKTALAVGRAAAVALGTAVLDLDHVPLWLKVGARGYLQLRTVEEYGKRVKIHLVHFGGGVSGHIKLVPKFLDLPPGTRIVANTFWVQGWTADDVQTLEDCDSWCTSQLFIIPAKVQGSWRAGESVLSLTQTYQMIEGTYTPAGGASVAVKGRLWGDAITVTLGGTEYDGTVKGATIQAATKTAGQLATLTFARIQ
jgi:hypothetical protein